MTDVPALSFVEQASVPDSFNSLLFGPMGSGKTAGAATAPGPILWLNTQGPGAIRYARRVAQARGTQIMEIAVPRRDADFAEILRGVLRYWRSGQEPRPKSIVVDTVGDMRDRLAKQYVVGPESKSRNQWGEVAKVLKEFVMELRDEPVNLVLIAHEIIEDAGDDRIVRPAIGGVLTEAIPNEMDVVGYCGVLRDAETGEKAYVARFVEERGRRAKDRSNGLGEQQPIDVGAWLTGFIAALTPDDSDVPFGEGFDPERIGPDFAADLHEQVEKVPVGEFRAALAEAKIAAPDDLRSKDARLAFLSTLTVAEGTALTVVLGGAQDAPEGAQEAAA